MVASVASAQPNIAGNWQGTLDAGVAKLRLGLRVAADANGGLKATFDSLDQNLKGAAVQDMRVQGNSLHFSIAGLRASYDATLSADGMSMQGTFTQVTSAPLELRRVTKFEAAPRPQQPQPPFPYSAVEVQVESDGAQLAGTLTIPSGTGPFPAAILISGAGAQDRDGTLFSHKPFWVIADNLTRRGIAVLRVDDRGTGKSTGSAASLTLDQAATDIVAEVEFLKARADIDAKRLGLIGHGEGGIVGPLAAARSVDVAFLVMLAGVGVPGEEQLTFQAETMARAAGANDETIARNRAIQAMVFGALRAGTDRETAVRRLTGEFRVMSAALPAPQRVALQEQGVEATLERRYIAASAPDVRSLVLADPAETLRRIRIPVLALNGARDAQVLASANLAAVAAALSAGGNPDFTVTALPGLNHQFQTCGSCQASEYGGLEETFSPIALAAMGDWIVRHAVAR